MVRELFCCGAETNKSDTEEHRFVGNGAQKGKRFVAGRLASNPSQEPARAASKLKIITSSGCQVPFPKENSLQIMAYAASA